MASREEKLDQIPMMIASGMKYSEIAEELGMTKSQVVTIGAAFGSVRTLRAEMRVRIAELTAQGLNSQEIANELGCSVALIRSRWSSIPSISNKAKRKRRQAEIDARRKRN